MAALAARLSHRPGTSRRPHGTRATGTAAGLTAELHLQVVPRHRQLREAHAAGAPGAAPVAGPRQAPGRCLLGDERPVGPVGPETVAVRAGTAAVAAGTAPVAAPADGPAGEVQLIETLPSAGEIEAEG